MLTLNARSLCNKLHVFESYVKSIDPDFITITETWARPTLCDSVFSIVGYNLFRKDRVGKRGGGVMIYVRHRFPAIPCYDLNNSDQEALFCEIRVAKTLVFLGVVYRPPGSKDDSRLMEVLSKVPSSSVSCVLITGDFNYPDIDWQNFRFPELAADFVDFTLNANWTQMVSSPTRERNVLDLLFTKSPRVVYTGQGS